LRERSGLSVRELAVEFSGEAGSLRVLDGVSFDILPGRTVALVGESGSGKSLIALSILRLLPPRARIASGQVTFAGLDLLSLAEEHMRQVRGRRIGIVFQDPLSSLNPAMRVGAQVAEALRAHGRSAEEAKEGTAELLSVVGLPAPRETAWAYPHELSSGMRQRVLIAIAIACGPDLLIADEATSALDVTVQAQILELLARLRREMGLSVLLITHDLAVVAEMADEVFVLHGGRVVDQGAVAELFARPRHPQTQALLGAVAS
jgi:ABC-type dipeptide/oligopeptide/nickel transport system ATPase component